MQKTLQYLFMFVTIASIVGCATVGSNFNYQNKHALHLGGTSRKEAEQLFGKPYMSANKTNRDGQFEILDYVYGKGNIAGVMVRSMSLEFRNGVLNAYIYSSGFEEDSTDFDINAIGQVKRGSSTKNFVAKVMGEPSGKALCPTTLEDFKDIANDNTEIWAWVFVSKTEGLDIDTVKIRTVKVTFDGSDVVNDMQTMEKN